MTLDELAIKHGSDKSSKHHGYCEVYEKFFHELQYRGGLTLLEIGYGGYEYPDRGGAGARMWSEYFINGQIVSIDIHAKNNTGIERFRFFQGSQIDDTFLANLVGKIGNPDIIVDDGSHNSIKTMTSFYYLFPELKPGGWYVIEDLEASYWDNEEFQGGLNNPRSTVNSLKDIVDTINHKHSGQADHGIHSIHFYEKIAFIQKKA